jgi:hypothetical protein
MDSLEERISLPLIESEAIMSLSIS